MREREKRAESHWEARARALRHGRNSGITDGWQSKNGISEVGRCINCEIFVRFEARSHVTGGGGGGGALLVG